jgi:hypothetical protein
MHAVPALCILSLTLACAPAGRTAEQASQPRADSGWLPAQVRILGSVPRGAPDSVITARVSDSGRVIVMYTFDNPCDLRVAAKLRRVRDTVAVRFTMTSREPMSPQLGSGCPAMIRYETFAVDAGPISADSLVVHSAYGSESTWSDLPQRRVARELPEGNTTRF